VTRIDLQTGETIYAGGFAKIVGVLVANGKLYISDQGNSTIFVLPLDSGPLDGGVYDGGASYQVLATLPVADQICAGPVGTIFTGQSQAAPNSTAPISVRQIKPDGTVTLFRSDPDVGKPAFSRAPARLLRDAQRAGPLRSRRHRGGQVCRTVSVRVDATEHTGHSVRAFDPAASSDTHSFRRCTFDRGSQGIEDWWDRGCRWHMHRTGMDSDRRQSRSCDRPAAVGHPGRHRCGRSHR